MEYDSNSHNKFNIMVSTNFDEDTAAGSIGLADLEDIATSQVGVSVPPSIDLGEKPSSIASELKEYSTIPQPKLRPNDTNWPRVVTDYKNCLKDANASIKELKSLATHENKARLTLYNTVQSQVKATETYGKTAFKKAGKVGVDNKRCVDRMSGMKEEVKKWKEAAKEATDLLKEVKKEKEELKKEKKSLMNNITALNKSAQENQKTISRHEKTIETFEKQLLKKNETAQKDDDWLQKTYAKNDAKLQAQMNQRYMDLHFKEMENEAKAKAKTNRIFSTFGGGGMGMMGAGMMGSAGMMGMGGIQNSWNNRMDMRAQYGGMGRYGNSPAYQSHYHSTPMDKRGASYHGSSYHSPHDGRYYHSPPSYQKGGYRRTPSSRDRSNRRHSRRRSRSRSYSPPHYARGGKDYSHRDNRRVEHYSREQQQHDSRSPRPDRQTEESANSASHSAGSQLRE